jgi:hypothetical protein
LPSCYYYTQKRQQPTTFLDAVSWIYRLCASFVILLPFFFHSPGALYLSPFSNMHELNMYGGNSSSPHHQTVVRHTTFSCRFGSLYYNAAATKCFFETTKEWNWSLSRACIAPSCSISYVSYCEIKLLQTLWGVKLHLLCSCFVSSNLSLCSLLFILISLDISHCLFRIADWLCNGLDRATSSDALMSLQNFSLQFKSELFVNCQRNYKILLRNIFKKQ